MDWKKTILALGLSVGIIAPVSAIEINLLKVDSPEGRQLSDVYGQAYGFPPAQVAPALMGPAEEVPSILRIAQVANTSPLAVWGLRKMGLGYPTILSAYALSPNLVYPSLPVSGPRWNDRIFVDTGREYFLRNVYRVEPRYIPFFPRHGHDFYRAVLYPYHPRHGAFLPPGQAKKLGLWVPPGQRNKGYYWGVPEGRSGFHKVELFEKGGGKKHGKAFKANYVGKDSHGHKKSGFGGPGKGNAKGGGGRGKHR